MALKISNDIVINDDAQILEGSITKNVTTGNYDSAVSAFSGGGSILDTGAAHYIKQSAPNITYSSGRSNYLIFDEKTDRSKNLGQNFIMEIPGNSGVSGFGKSVTQIGYITIPGFSSGGDAENMDISPDGLNWYIFHKGDLRVKSYTNTVPWGVSTVSYDDYLDVSSQISSSDTIYALRISEDGYWLYIIAGDNIYQYTLSTAFDISSASYDGSISRDAPVDGPNPNNLKIQWLDFRRDGKKVLVADHGKAGYEVDFGPDSANDITDPPEDFCAIWDLSTPWDLTSTKTRESWAKYSIGGQARSARVDPDSRFVRTVAYSMFNVGSIAARKWLTPWYLDSDRDTSWLNVPKDTPSGYNILSFTDFKVRPGGHHAALLFKYNSGDRLYKYNIQDSSGAVVPESFTFPPYVHFEDGAVPEFPLDNETLYLEFMTPDSGENYYAKELYRT